MKKSNHIKIQLIILLGIEALQVLKRLENKIF